MTMKQREYYIKYEAVEMSKKIKLEYYHLKFDRYKNNINILIVMSFQAFTLSEKKTCSM